MSEPPPEQRRLGRVGAWVCRAAAAALLLAASAWLAGARWWAADLLAAFAAQWALLSIAAAVFFAGWRRWDAAIICLAACAVALAPLRIGRTALAAGEPDVRLLIMNAFVDSSRPDGALERILESDADIVCVLEPPDSLLDAMRASSALHDRYPTLDIPERAGAGWRVVMSRWPMSRIRPSQDAPARSHGRSWRIDTPSGPLVASVIHPESPRSPARWRDGNADVRAAIGWVRTRLSEERAPIVLFGDLNSTPSGWRSRALFREAGLRRAKPLLRAVGTWPSAWSWPASLAIDDALVSERLEVVSWLTRRIPGSDHRAVEVGLRFVR